MSQEQPATDGGAVEEWDVFGQLSDVDDARTSSAERIERMLDYYFYTPFRVAWSDWRARIGGFIVLFYLLMGTAGVAVIREPEFNEGGRFVPPFSDPQFPLGTDAMGQDLLRSIIHATPAMLQMALAGLLFSAGVAVLVGFVAGYKGGLIDRLLMTFTDIVLTLPGLPLILVIVAIIPPRDPFLVGVIISIDSWPGLARTLRSQVLTIREESYVEASRAIGQSTPTIINRDVIPQMAPYILINSANAAVGVISASVGLYFLGLLPFTTLNWGVMMNFAHDAGALVNPWAIGHWLFFPALALAGLTFGTILFSQGLDRVFNPRLRARHSRTIVHDEEDTDGEPEGRTGSLTQMAQK